MPSQEKVVRDRAHRLCAYLEHLTKMRLKVVTHSLDNYEEVVWFHDIPEHQYSTCVTNFQSNGEEAPETWIEIKKPPILSAAPKIPDRLIPWTDPVTVADFRRQQPGIRKRLVLKPTSNDRNDKNIYESETILSLDECPHISDAYRKYVKQEWGPWADHCRQLERIRKIHSTLFSIYQRQQQAAESFEVLVGVGCLTWKKNEETRIKRHVLVAQTFLTFELADGTIAVGPGLDGPRPVLEEEVLGPLEVPNPELRHQVQEKLDSLSGAIWNHEIHSVLRSWLNAVHPEGTYDDSIQPPTDVSSTPTVRFAPALILRKRTEKGLIRTIQEIKEQLEKGERVPLGIQRLITEPGDCDIFSAGVEDPKTASTDEQLYLPLPSSEEQREIAEKISCRGGVVVQGPPGTGKSHTIANLICHLLATGKRLLITGVKPRPLEILRRFLPEEIRHLCVFLLGNDIASLSDLESSVKGIADRFGKWKPSDNLTHIQQLEEKLKDCRRSESSLLRELLNLRQAETSACTFAFGPYAGTPAEIAEKVLQTETNHNWIGIRLGENQNPPLSTEEAVRLLNLLRELDNESEETDKEFIDPTTLANPVEFVRLIEREAQAKVEFERTDECRQDSAYSAARQIQPEIRGALLSRLNDFRRAYELVILHPDPWVREAVVSVLSGNPHVWTMLLQATKEILRHSDQFVQSLSLSISGVDSRPLQVLRKDAENLVKYLEEGGSLRFWGLLCPPNVRKTLYLRKEILIEGQKCDNVSTLQDFSKWLRLSRELQSVEELWSPYFSVSERPAAARIEELRSRCDTLEQIMKLAEAASVMAADLDLVPGLANPVWHDPSSVALLKGLLVAVEAEENVAKARQRLEFMEDAIQAILMGQGPHPVMNQFLNALESRDHQAYAAGYSRLTTLQEIEDKRSELDKLIARLRPCVPEVAEELARDPWDKKWDERMARFEDSWNWARGESWLKKISEPGSHERLAQELTLCRRESRELIGQLAAAKAWDWCFKQMTPFQVADLIAFEKTIKKVGKGKGKFAPKNLKAASGYMEKCLSAIPAWVMPIYRVAETAPVQSNLFDVVIMDEASQAGPEAIFLMYMAKKIIVVGDDKQISPEFIGMPKKAVDDLLNKFISDIPHNDFMGVDNSFFDLAQIKFAGKLSLREHFRCMPEIIQFCNENFYGSDLWPLRQFGTDRLSPVIQTCHIPEGYVQGADSLVNLPEAEAIVAQIRRCLEDPHYDGKTMGVISLRGSAQALEIEKRLLAEIGPQEMERRQLVCGDAYLFQGDQRDVMFLSMVVATTKPFAVLNKATDERRFNVAVSRARDQLWLFHSVTLNDLNPACLRYKLLQYCANPYQERFVAPNLKIDDLRAMASQKELRRTQAAPFPFDSWFEIDVFLRILDKGYRVTPRFELAGYRIDIVVEGTKSRLAVECDGDFWHGPDRYEEDVKRQIRLERCGLPFWRVRGSTFYRDPEIAMKNLWSLLENYSIGPVPTVLSPERLSL